MNLFTIITFATEITCDDGSVVDASVGCIDTPGGLVDSYTSFSDLFLKGADLLLMFSGSIATIILIFSALQYSLAMGDEAKTDLAKLNMKWAGIGLIVSLFAYLLVDFVLTKMI